MSTARVTPAQNPRGAATITFTLRSLALATDWTPAPYGIGCAGAAPGSYSPQPGLGAELLIDRHETSPIPPASASQVLERFRQPIESALRSALDDRGSPMYDMLRY